MPSDLLLRARELDAKDELREFRDRFVVDEPELIYLDGNSLGRLPKLTAEIVSSLVRNEWGKGLVRGWHGWYNLPQRLGAKIARIIGADEDEVVVCDSTSVNLFKLTLSALFADPERPEIVTDDSNFPSDIYISASAAHLAQGQVSVVRTDGQLDDASEVIERALNSRTGLVSLSHTLFKSGYVHDMPRITAAAHAAGALVIWDLSHSVGGVPVDLKAANADLAVGCTYKYLNGGPGAPAFLFVRKDLQERLQSPIWGWFGQRNPFGFDLAYEPAEGMARFLAGTPPILSMAAIEPGIDLILEAGMDRLRTKSLRQTDFLIEEIDRSLVSLGCTLITPREHGIRGSHVSISHPEAWRINQALIHDWHVIPDFRAPNVLRLGVTPLYTTFEDLALALERICEVIQSRSYERYAKDRTTVT